MGKVDTAAVTRGRRVAPATAAKAAKARAVSRAARERQASAARPVAHLAALGLRAPAARAVARAAQEPVVRQADGGGAGVGSKAGGGRYERHGGTTREDPHSGRRRSDRRHHGWRGRTRRIGGTRRNRAETADRAGTAESGKVCGGIAGLQCDLGEWCDFPGETCGAGNQQGQCQQPQGGVICAQIVVCGCDGKTYQTACSAHLNGVDTVSNLSCIPGNGGSGAPCGHDADCMSGYKCCVTAGRIGAPIACQQVASGAACPSPP